MMTEESKAAAEVSAPLRAEGDVPESGKASGKLSSKIRFGLMGAGGLAVLALLIWLIVGRVQAFTLDSDKKSLSKDLRSRNDQLANVTRVMQKYKDALDASRFEAETVRNKNAQLHKEIGIREETIDELRTKLAAKESENDILRGTIKEQQQTIGEQKAKMEELQNNMDELTDKYELLYSDMRMSTSMVNQQLQNNQALGKQLEALKTELKSMEELIGKLNWELVTAKEKLGDEQLKNAIQWTSLQLIEKKYKYSVTVESKFKGKRGSCSTDDFYKVAKDLQPNLFLATEASSGLIFGGYTEKTWATDEHEFKTDANAFTFSATNHAVCTLIEPTKAISTKRERDGKKVLLAFGGNDISLGDDCVGGNTHTVIPNYSYTCPKVGPANFYTEERKPVLSQFEFFRITVVQKP